MKKLFALLLAAVVVFGMVACAPAAPTNPNNSQNPNNPNNITNQEVDLTPITFPLETPQTLKISFNATEGIDDAKEQLSHNVLWQELLQRTNIKVELNGFNLNNVASMFQTGSMGDLVMCGGSGQESTFANFAAMGLLQPLEAYINSKEIMPNLHANYLDAYPEQLANYTFPDGHIYIMGSYATEKASAVEAYMWINKTWLDKADMDIPETFEELEAALEYFATHDMNGNNKDDEVPFFVNQENNIGIEYIMGMWGVSTKDGTYDNYVTVQDGVVQFVPQMDIWKTFLKKMNEWYAKGIIFDTCFTDGDRSDVYSVASGGDVRVGLLPISNIDIARGADQYVCMTPVAAIDGVDVNWYINPIYMGSKNVFAVPKTSTNAKLACAFMDLFYDPDITVRSLYGEKGNSLYRTENADGTFSPAYPSNAEKDAAKYTSKNTFTYITYNMAFPSVKNEVFKQQYKPTEQEKKTQLALEQYEAAGVITDEPWPRCYMDLSGQRKVSELRRDIFTLVNDKRAKWVTGVNDIDAEWDEFQEDLIAAGVEDVLMELQDAYDYWLENYNGAK